MSPKKLALVTGELTAGGAERVLSVMANYWAAHQGSSITIITLSDASKTPFYPLDPSIRIDHLGVQKESTGIVSAIYNNIHRIRVLRKCILSTKPDYIISFIDTTNIQTLIASIGSGIPVIVTEHISPQDHTIPEVWKIIRKLAYRNAARIVTLTERAANYFEGYLKSKIAIIKNPIPTNSPTPSEDRIALDASKKWFSAMGRLVDQKGFDILLTSFALLASKHPDWHLAIIGGGPLLGDLETLATRLGIAQRVRFLGIQKDPWSIIKQSQIFVLSSRYEGYPMALCEAMSLGVAVVSTDCQTGPREIITHHHNGSLCPSGNPEALAEAMEELIVNPDLRELMANNGKRILDTNSTTAIMAQWDTLLSEVDTNNS